MKTPKKTLTGSAGVIIAIISALFGAYIDTDIVELKEAYTVQYTGDMVSLETSLAEYGDNTIVAIEIASDGIVITYSESIQLEGGVDAAWDAGDILVLYNQDSTWVEIGRRLKY